MLHEQDRENNIWPAHTRDPSAKKDAHEMLEKVRRDEMQMLKGKLKLIRQQEERLQERNREADRREAQLKAQEEVLEEREARLLGQEKFVQDGQAESWQRVKSSCKNCRRRKNWMRETLQAQDSLPEHPRMRLEHGAARNAWLRSTVNLSSTSDGP